MMGIWRLKCLNRRLPERINGLIQLIQPEKGSVITDHAPFSCVHPNVGDLAGTGQLVG